MLAVIALVSWTASLALGLTMLLHWPRPPRTALVHLATASVGFVAWVAFLATGRTGWLAWTVFAWLVVVNTLGDMLMVGGWRGRTSEPRPRGARAYLSAAFALRRRPVAAAHALIGATTFFLVLLVALGL